MPSMITVAEQYHNRCVKLLIDLKQEDLPQLGDYALAAVCLLRSYEILAEDYDPNRHLSGAFAIVMAQPFGRFPTTLRRAGLFNYLREDVTYSLIKHCPLKIDQDLDKLEVRHMTEADEDRLNVITLILAKSINAVYGGYITDETRRRLEEELRFCQSDVGSHFRSYSETTSAANLQTFPAIWMLGDCYVAFAQYCLICESVLELSNIETDAAADLLDRNAVRVCGLAFTNGSPSVLVNSFGPISFCGRHLRSQSLRSELVSRLRGCRKETGWPVQRIINDLERYWNTPS